MRVVQNTIPMVNLCLCDLSIYELCMIPKIGPENKKSYRCVKAKPAAFLVEFCSQFSQNLSDICDSNLTGKVFCCCFSYFSPGDCIGPHTCIAQTYAPALALFCSNTLILASGFSLKCTNLYCHEILLLLFLSKNFCVYYQYYLINFH